MFRKFFKKNKSTEQTGKSDTEHRNLFEEFLPLSPEIEKKFEAAFDSIFTQMYEKDQYEKLKNYARNYGSENIQLGSLKYDNLNWNLLDSTDKEQQYRSNEGEVMIVDSINFDNKVEKGQIENDMLTYRNWVRDHAAKKSGGLIMCQTISDDIEIDGYECIIKLPKDETPGMDYVYFLNLNNYQEQKMYKFQVMVAEMNPTGMRDNISMHPICEIAGIELFDLMNCYRQDPYDKSYNQGNLMNFSEIEAFDKYFPYHPLSIIRREIRPKILSSIKFR